MAETERMGLKKVHKVRLVGANPLEPDKEGVAKGGKEDARTKI